jgi:hypothetical protein
MNISSEPTALRAVADRIDAVAADLRQLNASGGTPSARHLVDLAAAAASISLTLLDAAPPGRGRRPARHR